MNPITLIIGLVFCSYGFMVLKLRLQGKDEKFTKLEPMRKTYGRKLGSLIHDLGYGIIPLIFGVWIIIAGVKGTEIFNVFK